MSYLEDLKNKAKEFRERNSIMQKEYIYLLKLIYNIECLLDNLKGDK